MSVSQKSLFLIGKGVVIMRKNELNMASQDYEKLYNVWKNMKSRCYDKNSDRYYTYGARGIKIC